MLIINLKGDFHLSKLHFGKKSYLQPMTFRSSEYVIDDDDQEQVVDTESCAWQELSAGFQVKSRNNG